MTTNGSKLYVVCPKCRTLAGECTDLAGVAKLPTTCTECGTANTITKKNPNRKPARRGGLDPNLYFTPEELDTITAHVCRLAKERKSREAQRTKLIVQVLACSGIRAQELCDLQMRDLPQPGGPVVLYVRDGKGNVSAPVHVPAVLVDRITEYATAFRTGAAPDSTLFEGRTGKAMKYQTLHHKLRLLGEEMGLRTRLTAHKLRRSYGVKLYSQKKDLLLVQEQLRHSSPATTQAYARTLPGDAADQIAKMG